MKIKQIIALALVFLISSKSCLAVFPPPTPSQETLDRLKKLGEENLQKYGNGGVELINGEYVIVPTSKPIVYPTLTATPAPTRVPTKVIPTPTVTKSVPAKIIFKFLEFKNFIFRLFFR